MQKKEIKTLRVAVFRTPDGKSTCSSNATPTCTCEFLRFKNFGTAYVCGHPRVDGELWRRGETGYINPDKKCPLWWGKK